MIRELLGSLPILVQLVVGLAAILGSLLLARAVLRRFRNAIHLRMPQPYLGDGPNIEWAEQKRREIAIGHYKHDEHTQFSGSEWPDHGVSEEHDQISPNSTPLEIRTDQENSVGKNSSNEVIMTNARTQPPTLGYDDDQWAVRILGDREN